MAQQIQRQGKRGGRPGRNDGPARKRYWASNRLRERKIKNMESQNGMTRAEALAVWANRGRRKK